MPWAVYGEHSGVFFYLNPDGHDLGDPRVFDPLAMDGWLARLTTPSPLASKLRLGMLANGVDMTGKPGGTVSAVHDGTDVQRTVEALRGAIGLIRQEGLLAAA